MNEVLAVVVTFVSVTAAMTLASIVVLTLLSDAGDQTCARCGLSSDLVDDSVQDLGGGWLRRERIYSCAECREVRRLDTVTGPVDYLGVS